LTASSDRILPAQGYHMASGDPLLRLSGMSKRFGAVVVASELDFAVERGAAVGIIGPNGAGKTTLFGMITGTVRPDSGKAWFDGDDITHFSSARRCRRGIARSFQIPQPFTGMTVFENAMVAAAFGPRLTERAAQAHCMAVLERCGLARKANLVAGTLTLLDRKRLELARALAANPRLLLLDEVAGGLTEHECAAVIDLVRTVREAGVTIVWIEHVVHALIAVVDRLVVLHGGRFIADGAPKAVIDSPNVRQIYLGIAADAL
jgi:branched-chain amino acid transport system ATP-binding protein